MNETTPEEIAASQTDGVVNLETVMASYVKFTLAQQQLKKFADSENEKIQAETDEEKRKQLMKISQELYAEKERVLMAPVYDGIREAIGKVVKARGLKYVHNMGAVIYGGVNITQEVIAALD